MGQGTNGPQLRPAPTQVFFHNITGALLVSDPDQTHVKQNEKKKSALISP